MRKPKTITFSLTMWGVLALLLLATALLLIQVNAEPLSSGVVEVKIDNFSFAPGTLTIPAGTSVTWTNRDDTPHVVISEDSAFKSKVLESDDKFTYTFRKPGTFSYSCSIHPRMTGKVVVQ
jgi:plastocyanin